MDNPQEIKREKVRVVPIKHIDDFPDHPFKVVDYESMEQHAKEKAFWLIRKSKRC